MDNIEKENIALFDMDGTLCDYDTSLRQELEQLRAPEEPILRGEIRNAPRHIQNRADIIRSSQDWWASLPKFKLGWDILEIAKELGYRIMILTQGPRRNPSSWAGKKIWIDDNLGQDTDITITRDKGLVYGKVLVDDYPEYVEKWLQWRKRGLVIIPANNSNLSYSPPQVIRYDGTNLNEVKKAMEKVKLGRNKSDI